MNHEDFPYKLCQLEGALDRCHDSNTLADRARKEPHSELIGFTQVEDFLREMAKADSAH